MGASNKSPADRSHGGRAEGAQENCNSSRHKHSPHLGQELELIADWQDDLRARIARTRLRFELIGVSPEAIISLAEEADDFKRCCHALTRGTA
jgi:hypothetical protein